MKIKNVLMVEFRSNQIGKNFNTQNLSELPQERFLSPFPTIGS